MASMTIRGIDDRLKAKLRLRAAHHGRSMEEEAREILRTVLSSSRSAKDSLIDSIRARVEPFGGVELKFAPRLIVHDDRNRERNAPRHPHPRRR